MTLPDLSTQQINDLTYGLQSFSVDLVDKFRAVIESRFEKLEQHNEMLERQLATLTLAYAESIAMLEALISNVINDDPTKTEEFFKHLKTARQTMMDNLSYGTRQAQQSTDKFVAVDPNLVAGPKDNQES